MQQPTCFQGRNSNEGNKQHCRNTMQQSSGLVAWVADWHGGRWDICRSIDRSIVLGYLASAVSILLALSSACASDDAAVPWPLALRGLFDGGHSSPCWLAANFVFAIGGSLASRFFGRPIADTPLGQGSIQLEQRAGTHQLLLTINRFEKQAWHCLLRWRQHKHEYDPEIYFPQFHYRSTSVRTVYFGVRIVNTGKKPDGTWRRWCGCMHEIV